MQALIRSRQRKAIFLICGFTKTVFESMMEEKTEGNIMERVCKFLKDAGTYYLATVEATSLGFAPLAPPTFLKADCTSRPAR